MHSFWYRTNALLTFATTVLAGMCALASITDLFHPSDPEVSLELAKVEVTPPDEHVRNDLAKLHIVLDADLKSAFSWNTKQVFLFVLAEYQTETNQLNQVVLWDAIIQQQKDAKIRKKKLRQKYTFDDQGRNLRDRAFNLTVAWNVMPKVGRLFTRSQTFVGFNMPANYTNIGRG
eukprot:evm.model.scf_2975.1 EVM.evm.TU.scf_2975.1   scf_2975:2677-5001(-)